MLCGLGILMALLFGSMRLEKSNFISQILSSQLAFGLLMMSFSFRLFSFDALIRERESAGGVPIWPIYLGKLLGSITDVFFLPLAYVCGNFPFIESVVLFQDYWGLYFALGLAISGLSNFMAVVFTVKLLFFDDYAV
jgi:hypothetical protein